MKRVGLIGIMALVLPLGIYAQDATENMFTDDELTKYATVMKWAEDEKGVLSSVVKDSVAIWMKGSELTISQYNVLKKANKAGALEEVEATEGEMAMFRNPGKN